MESEAYIILGVLFKMPETERFFFFCKFYKTI